MSRTDAAKCNPGVVGSERAGEIVILTIDRPPINALNVTVRNQLRELIEQAGEPAELIISLMPIANLLRAGHRMELEIASRPRLLASAAGEGCPDDRGRADVLRI